jgi:hypothetical protein
MPLLIGNCPRCGAKSVTFDVLSHVYKYTRHGWQNHFEVFSVCRHCHDPTIFGIAMTTDGHSTHEGAMSGEELMEYEKSLNCLFSIEGYVSLRDHANVRPPEFLPEEIKKTFIEGAACFSIQCYNAAATMFRLCIDLVTRPILPDSGDDTIKQPNSRQRRDLGLRLQWLFENNRLDFIIERTGELYSRGWQ